MAFPVRERHTGKKMKDINSIAIEVVMKSGDGRVKIDEALDALAHADLKNTETLLKDS